MCISVAELGKVPFISGSTTNEVRVPPLMAMNAIHPEWMPETRIWHLGQGAKKQKAGQSSINEDWPAGNSCDRVFRRNYSPPSHITLFAHRQDRLCAGESGSPCQGTVVGATKQPHRFWPKTGCCADTVLPGLATRKPMLLFSFAGLLSFRIDDDKLLELLFQLPPRIPREDEPTIPIPLSTVSGSTPLDADPHFVRASHAQSRHAHCLSNWSRIAGAVSSPTAFCEIGPETGELWPLALERGHWNTPQIPQSPRHSEWELTGTCQDASAVAANSAFPSHADPVLSKADGHCRRSKNRPGTARSL